MSQMNACKTQLRMIEQCRYRRPPHRKGSGALGGWPQIFTEFDTKRLTE